MNKTFSLGQAYRALFPFFPGREKYRFALILLFAVIMALAELAITGLVALMAAAFAAPDAIPRFAPILWMQQVLHLHLPTDTRLFILGILLSILVIIAAKNTLAAIQSWHIAAFAEGGANRIRQYFLDFFLYAPFLWTLRRGTADLLFLMRIMPNTRDVFNNSIHIFSSLLMIATVSLGLVVASPLPALLFFVILGTGGWCIIWGGRKLVSSWGEAAYAAEQSFSALESLTIHGLKELRLSTRESHIRAEYARRLGAYRDALQLLQAFQRLPVGLLEILGFATLSLILVFLIVIQDASVARISGIMGFLAAAAWRCLPLCNRLVDQVTSVRAYLPFVGTLAAVLEEVRAVPPDEELNAPVSFTDSLRFDDVSFAYPEADGFALSGVSFSIAPGEMIGIVGLSGAGKSTLVNILTGLLPPDSGEIRLDGTALCPRTIRSWRKKVGYVAQSAYLFNASLAENIALSRWGDPVNRERVLECCRMAALDFVDQLENGIDTNLGDGGSRLSGGQAQRVAIARELYREPELLIFDEATSALDLKNEKSIQDTVLSLSRKMAVVIIAHRLTSMEGCDRVIWLDSGRVRAAGSAADILEEYRAAMASGERESADERNAHDR